MRQGQPADDKVQLLPGWCGVPKDSGSRHTPHPLSGSSSLPAGNPPEAGMFVSQFWLLLTLQCQ